MGQHPRCHTPGDNPQSSPGPKQPSLALLLEWCPVAWGVEPHTVTWPKPPAPPWCAHQGDPGVRPTTRGLTQAEGHVTSYHSGTSQPLSMFGCPPTTGAITLLPRYLKTEKGLQAYPSPIVTSCMSYAGTFSGVFLGDTSNHQLVSLLVQFVSLIT